MKCYIALSFILLCACVHHDVESDEGDVFASPDIDPGGYEGVSLKAAFLPLGTGIGGWFFLWRAETNPALSSRKILSPLRGTSGSLCGCSVWVINFSDHPVSFPRIEDLDLKVEIEGQVSPLLPLSHFASDFAFPKTLDLLEQNYPAPELPGRCMTQIYLACQLKLHEGSTNVSPSRLFVKGDETLSWIEVDPHDWEKFIRHPTKKFLENLTMKKGS